MSESPRTEAAQALHHALIAWAMPPLAVLALLLLGDSGRRAMPFAQAGILAAALAATALTMFRRSLRAIRTGRAAHRSGALGPGQRARARLASVMGGVGLLAAALLAFLTVVALFSPFIAPD